MLGIAVAHAPGVFLMKLKARRVPSNCIHIHTRPRQLPRKHKFHGWRARAHTYARAELNAKSLSNPAGRMSRTTSQLRGLHGAKIIRAGEIINSKAHPRECVWKECAETGREKTTRSPDLATVGDHGWNSLEKGPWLLSGYVNKYYLFDLTSIYIWNRLAIPPFSHFIRKWKLLVNHAEINLPRPEFHLIARKRDY